MPAQAVKFVAELDHVREVSMVGVVDLAFWNAKLKDEELMLAEKNGQAQILVIAAASKYLGMPFREVSFSVLIDGFQGEQIAAAYLLHAFNSSRLFAFCERQLFSTPYRFARIRVECSPAVIDVVQSGVTVFHAAMGRGGTSSARTESPGRQVGWKGPVLLPKRCSAQSNRNLFFAKIQGETKSWEFDKSADSLSLKSSCRTDLIQALIDSHFTCEEWAIREDATHAKSKTYRIDAATIALARAFCNQ